MKQPASEAVATGGGWRGPARHGAFGPLAWWSAAALAAWVAGPGPVHAQGQAPGPAAADDPGAPVMVTIAGKRGQRQGDLAAVQDTLDGARLERLGVRDQQDLFRLLPGVQYQQGQPNQALITIRGIGSVGSTDQLGTQQSSTGLYVEDVPFTDPYGFVGNADVVPFDLDRVELLRGPQGVLYGSSSLGGAVNIRFNQPDLRRLHGAVLAGASGVQHGGSGHAVSAMLNLPLAAGVAGLRAVAHDQVEGGYIDNAGTGRSDANRQRLRGGRLILALQPGPSLRISGTLLQQAVDNDDSFAVSPDPARLQLSTPGASSRHNAFTLRKLQVDWLFAEGLALTSITGLLDKQASYVTDVTRGSGRLGQVYGPLLGLGRLPPFPQVLATAPRPLSSHAWSQETRLASTGDGPLSFVAGFMSQRTRFDWKGLTVAPGGQALWGPAGVLLPDDRIGSIDSRARTLETAWFADAEQRWPGGFSLGVGARAYRTLVDAQATVNFLGTTAPVPTDTAEHGVTPRFTLKLQRGPHLGYVLVSKGYRFGGVNLNPPLLTRYRSDSLWNHEAGLRLVPAPGLRLDLTAFAMDWKDAQVSTLLAGPVPFVGVANAGRAVSRGLESAMRWQAPAGWQVDAALAWTDARTTSAFTAASGSTVPAGARLPGAARWQAQLQAGRSFAGPAGSEGVVALTQALIGPRVFDIEGRSQGAGHGHTSARVALARSGWEASLAVHNLFDQRAVGGAAAVYRPGLSDYTDYFVLRPRTWQLALRHDL